MPGSGPAARRARAALVLLVTVVLTRPAAAQDVPLTPAPLPTADAATAAPPLLAPASQPLRPPLLRGKSLQPGEAGYKSMAWAAAGSFGGTLLPVIVGGFLTRAQKDGVMWTGLAMIGVGQALGPSAGYWYAGERARFTWYRAALTAAALGFAGYPIYAYTGRIETYNTGMAAALVTFAVVAEAVALGLAAWDLSLLGEAIDRHNERPARPPGSQPRAVRAAAPLVAPLALPGGGGVGLWGAF